MRNTNLKIVHQVIHPEDQKQVGVLGLSQDNSPLLGLLERGGDLYDANGPVHRRSRFLLYLGAHSV